MPDGSTVNAQIVDSVADVVTLSSGMAPAQSFGMLDAILTETLGMAMYNAVSRQQGASMIGSAATTSSCAKMLRVPLRGPAPLPAPGLPETVLEKISAATQAALDAIGTLSNTAGPSTPEGRLAVEMLADLEAEAAFPRPKPHAAHAEASAHPQSPFAGRADAKMKPGQSPISQVIAEAATASWSIRYLQSEAALKNFDASVAQASLKVIAKAATRSPAEDAPVETRGGGKQN